MYVDVFLFHWNSFSHCHRILRPQLCSPSTPASIVDYSASRREQNRNSFCDSFQSKREHCPTVFEAGEHHTMGASSAAGRRGSHVCIGTVQPGWGPSRCYVCPGMYGMNYEASVFQLTWKFLSVWPTRRPQHTPSPRCSRLGGEALLWPAQTHPCRQVASCAWTGCQGRHVACRDNLLARLYPYMRCWQEKLTRNADLFEDGSIGGGRFGSTRVLGREGTKWGVYSHYWSHRRVAGRDICTRWLSSRFTRLSVEYNCFFFFRLLEWHICQCFGGSI